MLPAGVVIYYPCTIRKPKIVENNSNLLWLFSETKAAGARCCSYEKRNWCYIHHGRTSIPLTVLHTVHGYFLTKEQALSLIVDYCEVYR